MSVPAHNLVIFMRSWPIFRGCESGTLRQDDSFVLSTLNPRFAPDLSSVTASKRLRRSWAYRRAACATGFTWA